MHLSLIDLINQEQGFLKSHSKDGKDGKDGKDDSCVYSFMSLAEIDF